MKVGILDGHTIQALSFVRSLKKTGFTIVLFCEKKLSYGYYTRYADEKVICPSTEGDLEIFHNHLISYLNKNKLDVIFPMNDNSAYYISYYKLQLEKFVKILSPPFSVFISGYDKNKLMNICRKNNHPHPRTIDLENYNLEEVENIFRFPALIKPNQTSGARGFKKIHNLKELNKYYPLIQDEYGNCHLQEYIPKGGKQFKAQLLFNGTKIIAHSAIQKHRYYPINGGSSCFIETIENKKIIDICTKVLKDLNWVGFADFDLIEDPRDNEILIMEINPRVPACIKASIISGVDFPNLMVNLTLNKKPFEYKYNPGKYLRFLGLDILWLITVKKDFQTIKIWFQSFFNKDHKFQDIEFDDFPAFFAGTIDNLSKQLDSSFRKRKNK